jgi:ubiquinone/menaquinone biosynthesis C-methylase UbiE
VAGQAGQIGYRLDLDQDTIDSARAKYAAANLKFEVGDVTAIPFADASFDCAVSFETLEHLAQQEMMLAELRRVLRPEGILIISTPNRVEYSERRGFKNEFHVRELDEKEFHSLIARYFPAQRWFGQKLLFNSAMWPLPETASAGPIWIRSTTLRAAFPPRCTSSRLPERPQGRFRTLRL